MKIAGLQKLTLLDYPEHTACTVFLWGCNYRCPFCHNAGLVTRACDAGISEDEFFSFLEKRKGLLDGVCITGGEPLLHPELTEFIRKIRGYGYRVKLDTNGTDPGRLSALLAEGLLDMVAMDIKNSPEKYPLTAGTEHCGISAVNESIKILMRGAVAYEFRTTIVRDYHTTEDLRQIGAWIRGARAYYLQRFQDSGDLIGEGLSACTETEMQTMLEAVLPDVPAAKLRGIG